MSCKKKKLYFRLGKHCNVKIKTKTIRTLLGSKEKLLCLFPIERQQKTMRPARTKLTRLPSMQPIIIILQINTIIKGNSKKIVT